jgi:phage baseplate assembly protein W
VRAIQYPFQIDASGKVAETTNYDQIVRGQVIDAVMTNQGERVMRPRHGCDIQSALFDPTDELVRKDAASIVKTRLANLVPRAFVRSVDVSIDDTTTRSASVFTGGGQSAVVIDITYRSTLYATDTTVSIPVSSSEYVQRHIQREIGS